jgi:hypothetical protein
LPPSVKVVLRILDATWGSRCRIGFGKEAGDDGRHDEAAAQQAGRPLFRDFPRKLLLI